MLPPPITRPTPAPVSTTSLDLAGEPVQRIEVEPEPLASGERLAGDLEQYSRIRRRGQVALLLAHLEADEAANLDVLADFRRRFLDQIADRLLRLADPGLVDEALSL